jgi:hypothetical protein
LRDFVDQGGGLLVFAGKNSKVGEAGSPVTPGREPLLPAELVAIEGDVNDMTGGPTIDPVMPDHLITRSLGLLPKDTVTDSRFRQYVKLRMLPDARAVLRLSNQDPLLVERREGRGRMLLFASTPDRRWHNMVVSPAYPILLQEALTDLLRQENETPLTVGDEIVLRLPAHAVGQAFAVTAPGGDERKVQAAWVGGQAAINAGRAREGGYYEIRPADREAAESAVAVNLDPRESDVRSAGVETLRQTLPDAIVLAGDDDLVASVREGRVGRELWWYFAVAALVLLAVESAVARRFTRRKQASPGK